MDRLSSRSDPTTRPDALLRELGIGRLFDFVTDAVVISDASGRIVAWNPAATRTFGYEPHEALGLLVDALVPERLRARHRAGMERFARTGHGRVIDGGAPMELPAVRKDGSEIVVELTLSAIPDSGRPHVVAIIREVTDRVRLMRELERANRGLREANSALEAFTYVVSHDLKEPVRALDSLAGMLEEELAEGRVGEARDLAERTSGSARRLTRLVAGLLEVARASRVDDGDLEPTSVRDALESEECASRFRDLARERGADIGYEEAPRTPHPLANRDILGQVLGNLVLNAIRHNPRDHPRVLVRAEPFDASGSRVEICVEDDGPGFPSGFADGLGERSLREGGFGLAIVQRAVLRLGGRVWIGRSSTLEGAAVHLSLPASPPPSSDGGSNDGGSDA